MSLRVATSFVNTNVPGAYIDVRVKSTPVGVGASGNIAIIGEAEGGADFSIEDLKNNFFTPDQAAKAAQEYISGNIVDAINGIAAPSNDTEIQGSAGRVYVLKTNTSSKAQATVDTDYGTLKDQNYGTPGNKISYKTLSSAVEAAPSVVSTDLTTILGTPTSLNGLTFSVRVNGGATTVVTLSGTATNHDTIAELASEIDALLPADITCSVATGNTLQFVVDADAAAYRKGWGKSFELIDTDPGDLAAIGVAAGVYTSSQEPEVSVNVLRPETNTNETFDVAANIGLSIGYQGTTAVATINTTTLATTVTGGAGASQSFVLADFTTIQALVDFINSKPGYKAAVESNSGSLPPSILDRVSAIGICSSAAALMPGRIKRAMYNFKTAIGTSQTVAFEQTAFAGVPTPIASYAYLTGGAKGATTAAKIVDAMTALETIGVNFVIPLMSRDASADIADGKTDSSSTYSIDAIHAAVKTHALKMSTVKMKRNRIAMLSWKGSYVLAKTKSGSLASYRATLTMQDAKVGTVTYQPWYLSCIAAGMQSAGFYKSIVKRFANVSSFVDPSDFESGSPGDVSDALENGLLFLENARAGVRWVSDQTTYGFDTNFVYNSLQAVYLSDVLSLDLAESLGDKFTGKSLADVDAGVVLSFVSTKMDGYKKLKMIASSDDAPLGYKNVSVEIDGPVLSVQVEAKLATSIYFIPIILELSEVSSTAAQA